jgi:hypothetical protein
MRPPTNISNTAGDATARRVIEEIVFQASVMALHSAIEAASNGGAAAAEGAAARNDQLHLLVERARRPRTGSDRPGERPERKGV